MTETWDVAFQKIFNFQIKGQNILPDMHWNQLSWDIAPVKVKTTNICTWLVEQEVFQKMKKKCKWMKILNYLIDLVEEETVLVNDALFSRSVVGKSDKGEKKFRNF